VKCPVCGRDVGTRILDGQVVLKAHYNPKTAPPCKGSNRPVPEEFLRKAPATLFDE
jgi:hypothetical protein